MSQQLTPVRPSYIEIIDGDSALRSQTSGPETESAHCPLCAESRLSEFGICRARKTGRNLYCKACCRKKSTGARRAWRDRAKPKPSIAPQADLPLIGLTPQPLRRDDTRLLLGEKEIRDPDYAHHRRVLGAIHQGARTQNEIVNAIRLSYHYSSSEFHQSPATVSQMDQVGDSLARLMLGRPQKIKSDMVEGRRVYMPVVVSVEAENQHGNASFSALGGLLAPIMKGRVA